MISKFYKTEFTASRPVWGEDENDNPISENTDVGTFKGHIQQASAELSQNLGLSFTKAFTVWCPVDANVLEGDTLVSNEVASYTVRAIMKNNIGNNEHLEIVCELNENI